MSTSRKLWLGFGLLLVLLVASGLFVARRLALIESALSTIMAVQEPATAATYEMAVNVSATATATLGYVDTGTAGDRVQVDSLLAAFDRLKGDYDRIARSDASRELGARIAREHGAFRAIGDSLMAYSDHRRRESEDFARASDAVIHVIERELVGEADPRGRDAQKRQLLALRLDAGVAAIGSSIGHYLRTRDARHKSAIAEREAEIRPTLQLLRDLRSGDDERRSLLRAERAFDEFETQGGQVIERVEELRSTESRFMMHGDRVTRLVDEGIRSLARTDLVEAQKSALQAIHISLIAVLVLLVAGILIGSITAIPAGRSIVSAEARIREQAEQLRLRMEDLSVAHRRKDEFLGVLGHELRNPLAPLSNALHVLAAHDASAPAEVRAAHVMMRRQVHNMTRLVDDLLDVSRVNEGKITLRREPVDLGAVSAEVADDLMPAARARHHRVTRVAPERGPWVDADSTRLVQIVSNLLYNALKYTPDGGEIRLEVESRDGEALLRVRDNGIGIAPEMRATIFEPYVQGDASLAPQQGGLGIGLSLVRRLVELHGGSVGVESAGLGQGSTFTVRLPALRGAPAAMAPAPPLPPASPRRILVVDDNADAARTLGALLELWGHHVRIVHDGAAALRAAAEAPPELVFLDIGLPDIDGYAIAARLRERPATRAARIVALTGFGQESDRQRALAAGFDEHMTKPVDPGALRQLLAMARG